MIAAEKDALDKQIDLQSAAAAPGPASRPVPGEMGRSAGPVAPKAVTVAANDDEDAPISLLGVVSGRVAITRETVRRREEVDRVRKTLQPQIDVQKKRQEQYDLEIRKLSDQKSALDQQRDQALTNETSSERRDEIRRRFELQKDLLTEQQDEWERRKNESDAEVEKILQDPTLAAAEREFKNQLVRDARKFFPQPSP